MKFRLLILGVRTCRKKYMLTNSYFCHSYHIYRRHLHVAITAGSENVPDSQFSAYRRKYYHLFKQKVLSAHIRKKTHVFGKIIRKELTRFAWSKPLQKIWTGLNFDNSSWFSWTKTIIFFYCFKDCYLNIIRNEIAKSDSFRENSTI